MRRAALVFALGLGAGAAGAQDRTLPAKLGAPARAAVQRLIDSAGVAGLPVDPLYSKTQEGVFRGADDARVLAAVQRLARDLGDGRAALGEAATAEEITAAADALRAGVAKADLTRIRQTRAKGGNADQRLTVALVVLADLAMRGVPPSLAAASVNELVARNVPDGTLISFRQTVERDLLNGRSAASALDARTRSIVDDAERRRP